MINVSTNDNHYLKCTECYNPNLRRNSIVTDAIASVNFIYYIEYIVDLQNVPFKCLKSKITEYYEIFRIIFVNIMHKSYIFKYTHK